MEKNEKIAEVLNDLIEINNDRIEGYEKASTETEENDLKITFAQFAETSKKCRQELTDEVKRLGGTPTDSTKATGKLFRAWMDVKTAVTGHHRRPILNERRDLA